MNLLELILVWILVASVTLSARGIGHLLGVPKAAAAILLIVLLALLMRLGTRISNRTALYYAGFLTLATFLSMAVERFARLDIRGLLLIIPLVVGVMIVVTGAIRRSIGGSDRRAKGS